MPGSEDDASFGPLVSDSPEADSPARTWWPALDSSSTWLVAGAVVLVVGSLVAAVVVARQPADESVGSPSVDSTPTVPTATVPLSPVTSEESTGSTTTGPVALSTLPPATSAPTTTVVPPATAPPQDIDDPSVVARPVPVDPPPPPSEAPPPPWAASTRTTSAGLLSTDVGCAEGLGAGQLDQFFAARVGPVLGWDYQHVVSLGGGRALWLFQDTFLDHSGTAETLDKSGFAHNVALLQDGPCFSLLHQGSTARPQPFEQGTGSTTLSTWFWPMGGEVHNGQIVVFWAKMVKDRFDPNPPDGLGWHPTETWIASYDANTLQRLDFRLAPNSGVAPIYGYAVVSDAAYTYLFGNTFEQNLSREGGYWNGPHSATRMYLARVPRGNFLTTPEYRTADGWSDNPAASVPILSRHWAEFPFQPRLIDGQWVGVAAVDGYWDEFYSVDVATDPWGPWTTVESRRIDPRNGDPKMNTYHAHLMPERDGFGQLVVTISNNARNMLRDAWPRPDRYRPMVFNSPWVIAPTPLPPTTTAPTTTTTTTLPPTTTTSTTSTSTTTTSTTSTTTTLPSTTTTSSTTTSTSTTSTTSSTSTTSTTTTTVAVPDAIGAID